MKKIIFSLIIIVVILSLILIIFRGINGIKQKQSTAQGVLIEDYIELGGIDQYVKIVGQSRDNPVIIFLHGGPGFPINYLSYYFTEHLTDDFTIVLWDQRGCGRTYYQNTDADLASLTIETMVSDLDDLVGYVMNVLDCEEVIIMGQSWGTVLGTCYIEEFPGKVSSYIGIGQVVDFDKGKMLAAQTALAKAQNEEKAEDVKTLESSMEQFKASTDIKSLDIDNLNTLIVTSLKYLQGENELSGVKQMLLGILSPNFNLHDLKWFFNC